MSSSPTQHAVCLFKGLLIKRQTILASSYGIWQVYNGYKSKINRELDFERSHNIDADDGSNSCRYT